MNLKDTIDVAFMFPPGCSSDSFTYHLGIAYIQAYLAKHGYKSKQVIPPPESTLEECGDYLIATNAPVIGFSCYDTNFYLIRYFASYIKRKKKSTVVIVGGPVATFSDEIILTRIPEIDIVIRFDGEITTLELLSHISKGTHLDCLDEIKGISFRRNGAIIRTPDRPFFSSGTGKEGELDGLPSPYLDDVLDGTEGAGIITARGCTHHCTYCNFTTMSRHTIRYHSVDRIINELKVIQTTFDTKSSESPTLKVVPIHDDAFTLNPQRAKEICRQIIKEGVSLKLFCVCRADNLDEELVLLLKQAGFIGISFGIESAVPEVLRNIKKVCSIPPKSKNENYGPENRFLLKVEQGISWAKKYNMVTTVSIILGLPGETIYQGSKTIEFIRKLDVDSYAHNFLRVYPGTEIFNKASNYGINVEFSDSRLRYNTTHAYPVSKIPYLRNSSFNEECQEMVQTLLQTFAGGKILKSISGEGISSAIIYINNSTELSNVYKWLSHVLAVNGTVFVLLNENISHDELTKIRFVNYAAFLPSERRYILRTFFDKDAEVIYEMIEGNVIKWKFQFPLVQFTKYLDFAKKIEHINADVFPIFYLKEKIDVNVLSILSEISAKETECSKTASNFWLNGVFMDGCRWSKSVCPALDLKKIIITESGEIRPCTTGQTIGVVGNNIQELKNKTKKLYFKLRKNRKCDFCHADSWCAKCLFPYPLSPQEYCKIQRKYSNLAGIVISSKLANTYYIMND